MCVCSMYHNSYMYVHVDRNVSCALSDSFLFLGLCDIIMAVCSQGSCGSLILIMYSSPLLLSIL